MISELIKLRRFLDSQGSKKEAAIIKNLIVKLAADFAPEELGAEPSAETPMLESDWKRQQEDDERTQKAYEKYEKELAARLEEESSQKAKQELEEKQKADEETESDFANWQKTVQEKDQQSESRQKAALELGLFKFDLYPGSSRWNALPEGTQALFSNIFDRYSALYNLWRDAEDRAVEAHGRKAAHLINKELVKIANALDEAGLPEEANKVDALLDALATDLEVEWQAPDKDDEQTKDKIYDSEAHHEEQLREPDPSEEPLKEPAVEPYGEMKKDAASTRYCPDHIGVMLGRVGENQYQCELDGKIYNWEVGFTDYDGKHHAGGSVANQTPEYAQYGAPHRMFDTRDQVNMKRSK